MKKLIIYFGIFIFIIFLLPAFLTKDKKETQVSEEESIQENIEETPVSQIENEYQYNKYGTIKLLHSKIGEVEEVQLDDYLINVVSAEMPVDFEIEALKAQAIVARTYTIYKVLNKKHNNADICDQSSCCQAWISKEDRLARWEEEKRESNWQKISDCVNQTKGIIITYGNQPINAFFHSNSRWNNRNSSKCMGRRKLSLFTNS